MHDTIALAMTRKTALIVFLLAFATQAAHAAGDNQAEINRWLDNLETRGKQIRTFEARIKHIKVNPLLGEAQTRLGVTYFTAPDPASKARARFRISFEQLIIDAGLHDKKVDWVFDGQWLAQKDHGTHTFIKSQIVGPDQDFDPLRIDGPMPLPLGQKRQQVLERFTVQLIADPPVQVKAPLKAKELLHLRLTPRPDAPGTKGRKQFKHVDLWFDKTDLLPVKVHTEDLKGEQTTVTLRQTRTNHLDAKTLDGLFDTTAPKADGWKVDVRALQAK